MKNKRVWVMWTKTILVFFFFWKKEKKYGMVTYWNSFCLGCLKSEGCLYAMSRVDIRQVGNLRWILLPPMGKLSLSHLTMFHHLPSAICPKGEINLGFFTGIQPFWGLSLLNFLHPCSWLALLHGFSTGKKMTISRCFWFFLVFTQNPRWKLPKEDGQLHLYENFHRWIELWSFCSLGVQ